MEMENHKTQDKTQHIELSINENNSYRGEQLHHCTLCDKTFSNLQYFINHEKKYHVRNIK